MKTLFGFVNGVLIAFSAFADAADYTVSDIVATSRQPWENTVDIAFTITPPAGATAKAVKVDIVASNGVDDVYISDASLLTHQVRSSGRQTLQWKAGVDHAGAVFGKLKFSVSVKEEITETPPYMILDMKNGSVMYAGHSISNKLQDGVFFSDYMAFRFIPPTTSDEWKAISGGSEYFSVGTVAGCTGYNFASDTDLKREQPRRIKLTKGFYLAVYPIVWGQLERLGRLRSSVGTTGTGNENVSGVVTGLSYKDLRGEDKVGGYNYPTTTEVDPNSIVGVLRARTGLTGLDLPTDAQWDYAARAGSSASYWFTETDIVPEKSEIQAHCGVIHPFTKPCNRWGLYAMVGCCHQWTTTLGRTTDSSTADNYWNPEDMAVDPQGPATTYDHGYRITRGSHFSVTDADMTSGRDGKNYWIGFRIYRSAYRYPLKSNYNTEETLCGARLCLTVD